MLSSRQAHSPSAASDGPTRTDHAVAAWRRRLERVSLLWRVFAANTVVFVVAVGTARLDPGDRPSRRHAPRAVGAAGRARAHAGHRPAAPAPNLRASAPAGRGHGLGRSRPALAAVPTLRPERGARSSRSRERSTRCSIGWRVSGARAAGGRWRLRRRERARVARELHDEVGQTLTAIALRAERAAAKPSEQARGAGRDRRERAAQPRGRPPHRTRASARGAGRPGLVNALIALCCADRPARPVCACAESSTGICRRWRPRSSS